MSRPSSWPVLGARMLRSGRPAAILGHYLSAGDGRWSLPVSAITAGWRPALTAAPPTSRHPRHRGGRDAHSARQLLGPPQQVMARARAAQQTTLLDEIQADLRNARADWLHARDHLAGRDDERNRRSVAEAMDELDGLLDTWLETMEMT